MPRAATKRKTPNQESSKLTSKRIASSSSTTGDNTVSDIDIEDIVNVYPLHTADQHRFSNKEAASIRESLLEWYDQNGRILPWRQLAKQHDNVQQRAYAVWVSEIMLQQTRYVENKVIGCAMCVIVWRC